MKKKWRKDLAILYCDDRTNTRIRNMDKWQQKGGTENIISTHNGSKWSKILCFNTSND
uniref:Uncharacterized protein n=1 Tax=Arundo donax TaxID=35708 RepID=A0A0A9B3C8_ARUDO